MAQSLAGSYYIDGLDLWLSFGLFIENGTDGFLQYPNKKPSITHDWMDSNGKDVDLTKIYFESRTITLQCAIVVKAVTAKADFDVNYKALLSLFSKPGTRSFVASRLGDNVYHVFYKECNNFKMYTRLKYNPNLVACKFNLVMEEPEPKIDNAVTAIVDHEGRILIT